MAECIKIHDDDNVATVIQATNPGDELAILDTARERRGTVTAREAIPYAHKISLVDIMPGQYILKYGQPIGRATEAIAEGNYVHIHNVISNQSASVRG